MEYVGTPSERFRMSLYKLVLTLFLGAFIGSMCVRPQFNYANEYKAQILESNTIVYIKDSTHTYDPGDMVWVNLDTKYVDNADSTAMKCLIIKPM